MGIPKLIYSLLKEDTTIFSNFILTKSLYVYLYYYRNSILKDLKNMCNYKL